MEAAVFSPPTAAAQETNEASDNLTRGERGGRGTRTRDDEESQPAHGYDNSGFSGDGEVNSYHATEFTVPHEYYDHVQRAVFKLRVFRHDVEVSRHRLLWME